MALDPSEITHWIPHRDPFLFVDQIYAFEANQSLVGVWNIRAEAPFFPGHFPQRPVLPGVLMTEAMAQVGAILVAKSQDIRLGFEGNNLFFLAKIYEASFRQPVLPGDRLIMQITIDSLSQRASKFSGKAFVHQGGLNDASLPSIEEMYRLPLAAQASYMGAISRS